MIELTSEQRRALRADAHHLHPLVAIAGKGLTPTVLTEIDRCLTAHELVKVKLMGIEREERTALVDQICTELLCAEVQQIGNILILWREKPEEAKTAAAPKRKAKPRTKKQAAAALEKPRRRTKRT